MQIVERLINHEPAGKFPSGLIQKSQRVKAGQKAYEVHMTVADLDACCRVLGPMLGSKRTLFVTTPTVSRLYGTALFSRLRSINDAISYMVLDCTEATKAIDQVTSVCDRAIEIGLDRKGVIVGLGGGVCTDIVTVAASWIRRGIAYIRIPTTLVGQIDAAIGIKGAVNFHNKKSYLGCFYPPTEVVVTPSFLATLPQYELRPGFAEIIKIALVRDKQLFELVEQSGRKLLSGGFKGETLHEEEILWRSITGMLNELEPNIYEDRSYERPVDFGHTFSPLIESACEFATSHGEAVAIDMALSAVLAGSMGLAKGETVRRILDSIIALDLPVWSRHLTLDLCKNALRDSALHRGGTPNLVVPVTIGKAVFLRDIDFISRYLEEGLTYLEDLNRLTGSRHIPVCELEQTTLRCAGAGD
jgi:3-dehydroquinate synthase